MAEIKAKDVMSLRNKTGLPMMACKQALAEAEGDPERAEELLRKQLKGKMEARTERAAGEGRVAIAVDPDANAATIVELRAETDFTARNERFVQSTQRIAELALAAEPGAVPPTDEMTALVDELRIGTGENCSYARGQKIQGSGKSTFGSYVHFDGKTAVLLEVEGDASEQVLKDTCMHIAAAVPVPLGVTPDDIPPSVVEKERQFRIEQAMESGKPKEIAEKIVEGGMRKFFAEVALLEQGFIKEPKTPVKDVLGPNVRVVGFSRWQVGEAA